MHPTAAVRCLVALIVVWPGTGCLSDVRVPEDAQITCETTADCPTATVCEDRRCEPAAGNRAPRLVLQTPGRSVGGLTVDAVVFDANDDETSLSATLVDGEARIPVGVAPATVAASVNGTPVSLTLDVAGIAVDPPRSLSLELVASDGRRQATATVAVPWGNNAPRILALDVDASAADGTGLVSLTFVAVDDSSDPVTVTGFAVRAGGGDAAAVAFAPDAAFPESDVAGLDSSPVGEVQTLVWRAAVPVADDIVIDLTVEDAFGAAATATSAPFFLDARPRVAVGVGSVVGGRALNRLPLTVEVSDPNGDLIDVALEASLDGVGFFPLTVAAGGDALVDITPPRALTVAWDLGADVAAGRLPASLADPAVPAFLAGVVVRAVATDATGLSSEPDDSAPVALGNDPPTATLSPVADGSGGAIALSLDVADSSRDATSLDLDFRLDDGVWRRMAIVVGATDELGVGTAPGRVVVLWNSLAELNADATAPQGIGRRRLDDVELRVVPRDRPATGVVHAGTPVTVVADLDNQSPPSLEAVFVGEQGGFRVGQVPVVYRLFDEERDPVHIAFEFSLDGVTFSRCTEAPVRSSEGTLHLASAPRAEGGLTHTFVWDSASDVIAKNPAVQLRARLVDPFTSGDAAVVVSLLQPTPFDPLPGAASPFVGPTSTANADLQFAGLGVGDLDRDGRADLVAASNTITRVFLGDGVGPGTIRNFSPGVGGGAMTVGDLTGDGILDLVFENGGGLVVGSGRRSTNNWTLTGAGRVDAACASSCIVFPVSLDGARVIAVRDGAATSRLVRVTSTGGVFSTAPLAPLPLRLDRAPTVTDVDGDGDDDLVALQGTEAVVLDNDDDGAGGRRFVEVTRFTVGVIPSTIIAAELTGDDLDDLVVSDDRVGLISIHEAVGDGTFTLFQQVEGATFAGRYAVSDLNGDGLIDLVSGSATETNATVTVSRREAGRAAGFGGTFRLPVGEVSLATAIIDFNGDGRPDIAVGSGLSSTTLRTFLASPPTLTGATFSDARLQTPQFFSRAPATPIDLDIDGAIDLLVTVNSSETVAARGRLVGALTTGFSASRTTDNAGDRTAVVADVNSDGIADVLTFGQNAAFNAEVQVHVADVVRGLPTGTFTLTDTHAFGNGVGPLPVADDLTGDGIVDIVILATDAANGTLAILVGDGTGRFTRTNEASGLQGAGGIGIVDVNGDGALDIVVTNDTGTPSVAVLPGPRGAGAAAPRTFSVTGGGGSLAFADVDEDGFVDVVAAPQFNAAQPFAILRGQGSGAGFTFAAVAGPTLPITGRQPVLADANLDGRLDWATVAFAPSPTSVFITSQSGRGALTFGPAVEIPAPRNLLGVTALDLGGDGVPELVGADERHGAVTTFSGRTGLGGVARIVGLADGVGDEVDWRDEPVGGFSDFAAIAVRPLSGAGDVLDGLAAAGNRRSSGDFATLLRHEGRLVGRRRPLTAALFASGDIRHVRVADDVVGSRLARRTPFGPLQNPDDPADRRRAGLDLSDRADERGVIVELPLLPGRARTGPVQVFQRVARFTTAAEMEDDPLFGTDEGAGFLPRVADDDGGFRDVVAVRYDTLLIPENDAVDLAGGTVVGKRFVVDAAAGVVRVLTDELGALQAFDSP